MKKFKQTLSGILAFAMIFASLTVMPVVSYAETTIILDEDCSDAPVGKTGSATDTGEWKIIAGPGCESFPTANIAPVKAADSTGMTLAGNSSYGDATNTNAVYVARKLTQDTNAANLSEGMYEISFDIDPTENAWMTVSLMDNVDDGKVTDSSYKRNNVMNLINGAKTPGYDNLLPAGTGYIVQGNVTSEMWKGVAAGNLSSDWWVVDTVDDTQPVCVKIIADMGTGKFATRVFQNGEIMASCDESFTESIKTNGLGYIIFATANGDTKVSNLKVTKLDGCEGRFYGLAESFSNANLVEAKNSNSKIFFDSSGPGVKKSSWWNFRGWDANNSYNGDVVIDKTMSNSLKMSGAEHEAVRLYTKALGEGNLKGIYKLNYRMFVEAGEGMFEVASDNANWSMLQIRLDKLNGEIRHYVISKAAGSSTDNVLAKDKGEITGHFDSTKWCDIEMIINVPGGKFDYTVSQDGETLVSKTGLALNSEIIANGFNFVQMRHINTKSSSDSSTNDQLPIVYTDDIKIREYELPPYQFEGLNETFDNWSVSNTGTGWSPCSAASYDVASVAAVDGNNALSVIPIPTADGGKANTGIKYIFPEPIKAGTLNISYDFKYTGDKNEIFWPSLDHGTSDITTSSDGSTKGTWGQFYPRIAAGVASANYNGTDDSKGNTVATKFSDTALTPDNWYTISIKAKPAESKYNIKITDKATGAVFGTEFKDQPLEDMDGELQTQIAQMTFRTWSGTHYLDNVVITHSLSEEPDSGDDPDPGVDPNPDPDPDPDPEPEPEYTGTNETFDNWAVSSTGTGWSNLSTAYTVAGVKELDGEKVLDLTQPAGSANHGIKYIFPEVIDNGTLNISYDFMYKPIAPTTSGAASQSLWVSLDKGTADTSGANDNTWGQGYPTLTNGNPKVNYNLTGDPGTLASNMDATGKTLDAEQWYTISISVRPSKAQYDIKIADRATKEAFGKEFKDQPLEDRLGATMNQIAQLTFRGYAGENYIDNVIVEYIPPKPELSAAAIEMYDSFGAKEESITRVSRALKKIVLDFGLPMEEVSGISVTGTNVPQYSAAVDTENSNKAVVTFADGALLDIGNYVLTVPGTVKAVNGNTMGGEFEFEFVTSAVETKAELTGISVGGEAVEGYAALAAKAGSVATINTSVINISDKPLELTYVVAYYNDKMCLKVETIKMDKLVSGKALAKMPTFEISNVEGANKMKVFLWSTLNEMKPYCKWLEI